MDEVIELHAALFSRRCRTVGWKVTSIRPHHNGMSYLRNLIPFNYIRRSFINRHIRARLPFPSIFQNTRRSRLQDNVITSFSVALDAISAELRGNSLSWRNYCIKMERAFEIRHHRACLSLGHLLFRKVTGRSRYPEFPFRCLRQPVIAKRGKDVTRVTTNWRRN